MSKTAYSYVRFSSAGQAKGDSLRRQTVAAESIASEKGWTLDKSFRLHDLGVSAWKGRNQTEGALGAFLGAVKDGRVKKGAVLVIESIDRLSRQDVLTALELFIGILKSGVEIFTVLDRRHYTKASVIANSSELMISLSIMARANEESETKSHRISAVWGNKRAQATSKAMTKRGPNWLKLVNGKWHLVPDAVASVRRIVEQGIAGRGGIGIARQFNAEKVPSISKRKDVWDQQTIRHILRSRALIGEFQPMIGRGKLAKPAGPAIKSYFPPIISEDEFYRLQSVQDSRKRVFRGPIGHRVANVFGRLAVSGQDGSHFVLHSQGRRNVLKSSRNKRGETKTDTIAYAPFEYHFLRWVTELDLGSTSGGIPDGSRLAELESKLLTVRAKLAKIKAKLTGDDADQLDTLVDLVAELSKQERDGQRPMAVD